MAAHPKVQQFLNIKHNRAPTSTRAVAIEGFWAISHAAAAPVDIEAVFVCEALRRGEDTTRLVDELRGRGVTVVAVSERTLRHMVDRDGPDGLAAVVHLPDHQLDTVRLPPAARVVVVDAAELPGNVGAIVRCADGAGAAAVVLTDRRVRIAHPLVAKASMGTLFTTPVISATREATLRWLRSHHVRVVTADPAAAVSYRDADYRGRIAVVVGSERDGLSPFWREASNIAVAIPMLGVADSLNVAQAAALVLYEAISRGRFGTS